MKNLSYKEITQKAENMTVKQLVFFYNTIFGEEECFTYVGHLEDLKYDLTEEELQDYPIHDDIHYYTWEDGFISVFTDEEIKIWILTVITVRNFNLIDSVNINCKEWVNNVYVDSINNY